MRRNDFDALDEFADLLAAVRLDHRCDDVGSALEPAMRLTEHGAGFADARCGAQVDTQFATSRWVSPVSQRVVVPTRLVGGCHMAIIHREVQDFTGNSRSNSRLSASTFTTGSPKTPSG